MRKPAPQAPGMQSVASGNAARIAAAPSAEARAVAPSAPSAPGSTTVIRGAAPQAPGSGDNAE